MGSIYETKTNSENKKKNKKKGIKVRNTLHRNAIEKKKIQFLKRKKKAAKEPGKETNRCLNTISNK